MSAVTLPALPGRKDGPWCPYEYGAGRCTNGCWQEPACITDGPWWWRDDHGRRIEEPDAWLVRAHLLEEWIDQLMRRAARAWGAHGEGLMFRPGGRTRIEEELEVAGEQLAEAYRQLGLAT